MKELYIRNSICSWIRLHRGFVFIHDSVGIYDVKKQCFRRNTSPFRLKGASDILGIWRHKFLAIEVKNETGRVSVDQERFLELVNLHGGIGFVARSIEDVESELKRRNEYPNIIEGVQ